jgi:hypothetical protein
MGDAAELSSAEDVQKLSQALDNHSSAALLLAWNSG